jgi:hypothetical protein
LLLGAWGCGRDRLDSRLSNPPPEEHHQQTAQGIDPHKGPTLLAMAIQELL